MRIDEVEISNFRGLARVEAGGLADHPVVTVSGPNGAGKSLLFEAVIALWRSNRPWQQQFNVKPLIGPWDTTSTVNLTLKLSDDERQMLYAEATSESPPKIADPGVEAPERIRIGIEITPFGEFGERKARLDTEWARLLWLSDFPKRHAFSQIDYLPADRGIQRGEQAQVNPSMLTTEQTEGLRQQVFDSFIQQRQILTLTGIQPFLASLDYLDMLADRENRPRSGDFDAIVEPFYQATGKRINRLRTDPSAPFGASLMVDTPAGKSHTLDQLSSGEQEVLTVMYYVRRLSASGGLLLVDEPELHLHPVLQQSLFTVMESIAERAQVWIVTHSPRLVVSATLGAVLHMAPATKLEANQITKSADEEARGRLLTNLGVHPVDVLQNDSIVVVEGSVDASRLPSLLSLTLSRSKIHVAGNANGVEATARALDSSDSIIPWVAVRDRDLLTDEEVQAKTEKLRGLFIWPQRCMENELLSPPLVARTLNRNGRTATIGEITQKLREIADEQKPDIVAQLIDAELKKRHPYDPEPAKDPVEKQRLFLDAQAKSASGKLADFDQVSAEVRSNLDARWDNEWLKLLDGKQAIGRLVQETPFKTLADFISSIGQTIRDEPALMPKGLIDLQDKLGEVRATVGIARA